MQVFFLAEDLAMDVQWEELCTSIAKTFLPLGKKLASDTCYVCLASLKERNSAADIWRRPFAIPKIV